MRWGPVKSDRSRKKKWKHARLHGAQRREGVCVGLGCRGPECDFACFLRGDLAVLGANGDGAPPQAHIHLNLRGPPSGSPPTKFGRFVTVCNRHLGYFSLCCYALWGTPSASGRGRAGTGWREAGMHRSDGIIRLNQKARWDILSYADFADIAFAYIVLCGFCGSLPSRFRLRFKPSSDACAA